MPCHVAEAVVPEHDVAGLAVAVHRRRPVDALHGRVVRLGRVAQVAGAKGVVELAVAARPHAEAAAGGDDVVDVAHHAEVEGMAVAVAAHRRAWAVARTAGCCRCRGSAPCRLQLAGARASAPPWRRWRDRWPACLTIHGSAPMRRYFQLANNPRMLSGSIATSRPQAAARPRYEGHHASGTAAGHPTRTRCARAISPGSIAPRLMRYPLLLKKRNSWRMSAALRSHRSTPAAPAQRRFTACTSRTRTARCRSGATTRDAGPPAGRAARR